MFLKVWPPYHKLQSKTCEDIYYSEVQSWQATNYLSSSTHQKITLTGQIMLEIFTNSLVANNANGSLKNTKK